ncbi:ANTH-domain-containing protein [Aaosphaeria arxii CBS 175.79]|uniref:ANTH-domain-containing protein n=1 Tax=Aaosphaeria arxii CBS 175.79 TaxID=1450172 RepID=A0A6A5YBR1_9PLEO|nr:ANTH-domain-containing protein [Aaosphaeria arxii CBS 175.79]KAF2022044.1 ANTH-domain-containing protein [Aaosphaeria arxii CBS 175.79]
MASSFEKSVKGGTKIKLAAPKSKYVEHILVATHAGEAGVAEIFRALTNRLRDSTWTIVFKSLIIVHLMIREGQPEVTLRYLAQNPRRTLAINHFTEVQTQGHNIKTYCDYLLIRAKEFQATKIDYVRGGEGRLKKLNIEKGLLRETESVQEQIRYLLKCEPFHDEPENEITLTAFRLLTMDLLVLFHVMNEGTINVLEHYFELSKPDASRALNIYRTFVKQTEAVVQYLSIARMHEHSTRLEIPKIKHAPTSLAASLEEYLNDRDFEINRRQYLAEKDAKRNGGKSTSNGASRFAQEPEPAPSKTAVSQQSAPASRPAANAPLIDFFESIQDNQQTLAQPQPQLQQYPQQTGFQQPQQTGFEQPSFQIPQQTSTVGYPQQQGQMFGQQGGQGTNPFAPMQQNQIPQVPQQPQLQTQFTGAGFGGYTQQPFSPQSSTLSPIPQNGVPNFASQAPPQLSPADALQPQQTSTNPFRQSMLAPNAPNAAEPKLLNNPTGVSSPLARSPTNPFAKHSTGASPSPFSSLPSIQEPQAGSPFAQQQQPLQPTPTGTNPFARNTSPIQNPMSPQGGLTVHATGSTNPFRQSAFVNQQTGQGWQNSGNQGTLGGMSIDSVPTSNVFPRPGQQQGQQPGQFL